MPREQANPMSDPEIRKQVEERIRQLEFQQRIHEAQSMIGSRRPQDFNRALMETIDVVYHSGKDGVIMGNPKPGFAQAASSGTPNHHAPTEEDIEARRQIVKESYKAAVDGANNASWDELTKMAAEAPTRRADLEGIIRHLQGGQGAASEAEKL
ncbi:hypothetical protein CAEBREN_05550 [Caenorhabditis brenneri]|uniref:Uncharacterized protein n=1 Tax=Caenorhabditis brenneri TaxID=135651 RepID=G0P616_CAEBE|nr:hypothetical protein CAEBREN_05550 [Caenorhabditis brenneri]